MVLRWSLRNLTPFTLSDLDVMKRGGNDISIADFVWGQSHVSNLNCLLKFSSVAHQSTRSMTLSTTDDFKDGRMLVSHDQDKDETGQVIEMVEWKGW